MRSRTLTVIAAIFTLFGSPAAHAMSESDIDLAANSSSAEQTLLKHEITLDVGVAEAWAYFTDAAKLRTWMAPVAEVDLRPGGTIRSNYDPCASIGDKGTINLKIVSYVPRRFLTLQSDLESAKDANWMNDAIYAGRNNLYNLIEFHPEQNGRTRIVSWGLGYGSGEEWKAMMAFFEAGNDWSYGQLRKAISGETVWPACKE